ncbi:MAG: hypothetical protein E5Y67_12480 [Mesorhizobium sp.]|uniref:hypothetical protein n=1 Tax=Mesorhizobium sp. TaxID=1871066 RepID=UPI001218EDFF|nr:hypothetical protein [Mesorhizobium sp.]TIM14488.1 MAG: hypothetical protein E5Y67_12480 [Mesorhizobium sp.]
MATATKSPDFGDIQVGSSAEYDNLPAGFVIEEYGVHGWVVPAWEERCLPELEGVFPTREAALAALKPDAQCTSWPSCSCGRGGPDFCAAA